MSHDEVAQLMEKHQRYEDQKQPNNAANSRNQAGKAHL